MTKIRLGHSPDSDDAFMFWGLASGYVKTDLEFEHILRDIQTLNEWAMEGRLETTAVSVHAFAYISDKYKLLAHGGSFGDGYGPMIVSKGLLSDQGLLESTIAVPGKMTSAFLALNLYFAERFGEKVRPRFAVVPFDEIIPSVLAGRQRAGLIIHEGQLTYKQEGLELIQDLGVWWNEQTGLPLPLGVNVVRKDLPETLQAEISRCIRESIMAGLENREEALKYALQFARGLDTPTSDQFVGMYVNKRTLDMGTPGYEAIRLFLTRGHELGLLPEPSLSLSGDVMSREEASRFDKLWATT